MSKLISGATFLSGFVFLVLSSASETTSHSATGPHITDVDILLPPRVTHPVEYRLRGVGEVDFEAQGVKLQTTVTALSEDVVSVDAPKELLTNVPYPTKGYRFPVNFRGKLNAQGNFNRISHDCRVDPPFVGYVKPWLDLDTGNSSCLFFPYTPEHLVHEMPGKKDMKQPISISIQASSKEALHISGFAYALLIGGFSMLDNMELNLTPDFNKTIITIVGNTGVEFYWQERNLLLVSPIYNEDSELGRHAQYEVKVLGTEKFTDTISVILPANGQVLEIDVSYEPKPEAALSDPFVMSLCWTTVFSTGNMGLMIAIRLIRTIDERRQHQ